MESLCGSPSSLSLNMLMLSNTPSVASNYDTFVPPPASSRAHRLQRLKDIVAEALELVGSSDETIDAAIRMTPSEQESPEGNLFSFSLSLDADTFSRSLHAINYAHPNRAAYASSSRRVLRGELNHSHDLQAPIMAGIDNSGEDSRADSEASSLQSPYMNEIQFERQ